MGRMHYKAATGYHQEQIKKLEAKCKKLQAEDKRLQAELEKRKGAPAILQQISDKLKSLTGEQNVWKAIELLSKHKKGK